MAKKQTRRSISVSRTTYERLKAFCETSGISMSQFVEARVGESLSGEPELDAEQGDVAPRPAPPRERPAPSSQVASSSSRVTPAAANPPPAPSRPAGVKAGPPPMTSAAARYAVEPPPPIIKPKQEQAAPAPIQPTADQIFTF